MHIDLEPYLEHIKGQRSLRALTKRLSLPPEVLKGTRVTLDVTIPDSIGEMDFWELDSVWNTYEYTGEEWEFVETARHRYHHGDTAIETIPSHGLILPLPALEFLLREGNPAIDTEVETAMRESIRKIQTFMQEQEEQERFR